MNDDLPKLPSIDFNELNELEEQIAKEALRDELLASQREKELIREKNNQRKQRNSKKFNYSSLFALVAIFFSVTTLSYLGLTGKLNNIVDAVVSQSHNNINNNTALDVSGQVQGAQSSRTFNLNSTNKIAYVSSGNVWLMDYDGKDKHQITRDGSILKTYKNVEWKNSRELSFSACTATECKIYVFSLATDSATEVLSLQVPQINRIKWSPASDMLLVNYVKPNGALESSMWKNSVQTVLRQYNIDQNATTSFNDEINFVFSSDGQYFASENTLVNSGAEDQVVIYDINANQVATISGESSFPIFSTGNSIYFKNDNKIFRGKIGSIQSQMILDSFTSFETHLSKDGNIMAFWNLRDGNNPVSSFYNMATGELRDFATGFKSPKWLNESIIIGLKVSNYKGLYSYDIQKLASSDINGNIVILEDNNVTEFDVEGI